MATMHHEDPIENLDVDGLDDLLADAVVELQRAELPSLAAAVGAARVVIAELAAETPIDSCASFLEAAERELFEGLARKYSAAEPGERWVELEPEAPIYRCASPACPGRPYRASDMAHPPNCGAANREPMKPADEPEGGE